VVAFWARPGASAYSTPDARVKIRALKIDKPAFQKTVIALAGWQLPTRWHAPQYQLAIL
jgi:hypothetical protein